MNPDDYYEITELMEEGYLNAHFYLMKLFNNSGIAMVIACARMICDRAVAQGSSEEEVLSMLKAAYRNSEASVGVIKKLAEEEEGQGGAE